MTPGRRKEKVCTPEAPLDSPRRWGGCPGHGTETPKCWCPRLIGARPPATGSALSVGDTHTAGQWMQGLGARWPESWGEGRRGESYITREWKQLCLMRKGEAIVPSQPWEAAEWKMLNRLVCSSQYAGVVGRWRDSGSCQGDPTTKARQAGMVLWTCGPLYSLNLINCISTLNTGMCVRSYTYFFFSINHNVVLT